VSHGFCYRIGFKALTFMCTWTYSFLLKIMGHAMYCYSFLDFHIKNKKYKKKSLEEIKNNRSNKRMFECRRNVKIGLGRSKMQKVKI